jgi:uncharacterized protein
LVAAQCKPTHEGGSLAFTPADKIIVGKPLRFWRDWLEHSEPNDEWWASEDYSQTVSEISAPNHLITDWFDFMLPQLLRDYAALQKAGCKAYLTIGPRSHSSNGMFEVSLPESLYSLRAHLLGDTKGLCSSPVRIYVMGANEWRNMAVWHPIEIQTHRWYLQPDATLTTKLPPNSMPSQYRYDPANPTPNIGGATNATLGRGTGARDNRKLEARSDVLLFTSLELEQDTEFIGSVSAELFVQSSLGYTDFFIRLCDVHPDGKSMNICDGILRLFPGETNSDTDIGRRILIELWPTAYCFKTGHRIRVQVSSGAFPRFVHNLGTGELLATATKMKDSRTANLSRPTDCNRRQSD